MSQTNNICKKCGGAIDPAYLQEIRKESGENGLLAGKVGEEADQVSESTCRNCHARDKLTRIVEDAQEHLEETDPQRHNRENDDGVPVGDPTEASVRKWFEKRLADANHALSRLDQGTYGTCEHCEEPVGYLRQLLNPTATMCVSCLRAVTLQANGRRRP